MMADVLQIPLLLPEGAEIGAALGAARLAILAAGAGNEADICIAPPIAGTVVPHPAAAAAYAPRLARYRALYPAEKTARGG
jgi:xylulokinase